MRFRVHVERAGRDKLVATCPEFPGCRAEGSTREEALERIRNAIAYVREMCPCDLTSEAGVELDVIDATSR